MTRVSTTTAALTLLAGTLSLSAMASMRSPPSEEARQGRDSTTLPESSSRSGSSSASDSERTGSSTGTSGARSSSGASTSPGASSSATTTTASGSTDRRFVQQAMDSGAQEVVDAQHAQTAAKRSDVRQTARMLERDHTAANSKLKTLAGSKSGMPTEPSMPSASMTPTGGAGAATGADFDRAYIENQIRAHEKSIALFRQQANSGSDPELRRFAKETLPTLERHLAELQRLQASAPTPRREAAAGGGTDRGGG